MARGLSAEVTTAIGGDVTAPLYLVEMGFSTTARYSSRETVTWNSHSWLTAGMEVTFNAGIPQVSFFNENTTFGQIVLADGTAGRTIKVWQCHEYSGGTGPTGYTGPVLIFDGEMSDATIGDRVRINCKQNAPLRTPRHVIGASICNHLPPPGTRFSTPSGIIILER